MDIPIQPDVSGQILGAGISNAALNAQGSLSQLIQQASATSKQAKAYRAMAVDGLGMDPDQVNRMSLPELQGHMQAMAVRTQQQETQARTARELASAAYMQSESESADALGQMAPAAAAWRKANPGKNPSAMDVIQMMGNTKMAPRAQGIILSKLLPSLMSGESGLQPQPYKSPEGNPYVFFNHTLLPDRSVTDIAALIGNAPAGMVALPTNTKGGITWKNTAKALPGTYETRLSNTAGNGLADQLGLLQQSANQSDDEILARPTIAGDKGKLATFRKNNASQIQSLTKQIQNHLDSYRAQGYGSPDFWHDEYRRYDLTPPAGAPAASRDAGTPAAVSGQTGRVPVWGKDGSAFTIPAGQLDQALAAGYLDKEPTE